MTLTASQVKSASCPEGQKQKKVYDSKGLYLLLKDTGGKLWRLRYKFGGKHKEMALGKFPNVTLSEAREKAERARSLLTDGFDPMANRKLLKYQVTDEALNFEKIATRWFERNKVNWSSTYQTKLVRWLENDLKNISTLQINVITKKHLIMIVNTIVENGHKKKVAQLMSMINRIFEFAMSELLISTNPCQSFYYKTLVGNLPNTKNYAAITDSRKLGDLLFDIENNTSGTLCSIEALKILPHVFLRPSELRGLKWEYVDFDKKLIFIPGSEMKTKKDHIVPMSKQVERKLKALHKQTQYSEFVFPSEKNPCQPFSKNVLNNRLKALGYDSETMVSHGFRGTASTLLNEEGVNESHIETQLAHQIGNSTSRSYNRAKYLRKRKKMMQRWSDLLDALRESSDGEMAENT
jgi:integrase